MEARDMKRKEETENAKARLNDIKQLISETLYKITKTECEYNEAKAEHTKKMKTLQNTEAENQVRLCKLNTDLKNSEQVLQTRLAEEVEMQKVNSDLKQELQAMREATDMMTAEYHKKLQDLEEEINKGYAELHSEKDAEALWELGVNSVKTEEQVTLLKEVIIGNETTDKEKKPANST